MFLRRHHDDDSGAFLKACLDKSVHRLNQEDVVVVKLYRVRLRHNLPSRNPVKS